MSKNLTFGQRNGYVAIDNAFQINSLDKDFRTDLWNLYYNTVLKFYIENQRNSSFSLVSENPSYKGFHQYIWTSFLKNEIDKFPSDASQLMEYQKKVFFNILKWYQVYDFLEFILPVSGHIINNTEFINRLKNILINNNAAYTIINNQFVPITNEVEVKEIEHTQILSDKYNLKGIQKHLNSSIKHFSDKQNPDYRNSIKESISMVETICRIIEPTTQTLGEALKKLDTHQHINKILKEGFIKLYAYTNDKTGIRHAIMNESKIELEDARYFLISCSAFTNYLIDKAIKEKIIS